MFLFDSRSDFFVAGEASAEQVDSEIDSDIVLNFLEGYELDLSDENFKCEVLFLMNLRNVPFDLCNDFADLLVDNFRVELLKLVKNDPYLAFESALRKINALYLEFFKDTDLGDIIFDVGVILLVENKVFFTKRGEIDMYLLRSGQINQISDALVDSKDETEFFANVASGEFQKNDHFLIASDRLLRYTTFNDFLKFSKDIETFSENILENLSDKLDHQIGIMSCFITDLAETAPNLQGKKERSSFSLFEFKNSSSRFMLVFVTFILLISLIAGLVFTFKSNVATTGQLDMADSIQNIRNIILNAKSEVSTERAFYTLNLAEDKIFELEKSIGSSKVLSELKKEIEEVMLTIDNVVLIEEPLQVFDINTFNPNDNILGLFVVENDLHIVGDSALYKTLSSEKSEKVVNFEKKINPQLVVASPEYDSLLLLSKDMKLKEVNKKGLRTLVTNTEFSDSVVDMVAYGKRLYFLDTAEKNVFKLQRVNNGYYSKTDYFSEPVDFLESVNQLTIDGSLYVFTEKFQFNKFFKGELDANFVLLSQPYNKIDYLDDVYTAFDHSFIYALDAKSSMIYRFYKDPVHNNLEYDKVYSFPKINDVLGFNVNYNKEELFIYNDKKVYRLDLR